MKVVLTIAGSDSSGGAGIQADLKTFEAHGVFGCSVITALTAQNTKGVTDIYPVSTDFIKSQIEAIKDDFQINAIKIGMLSNKEIIKTVSEAIDEFDVPVVLDPVFISKAGSKLLDDDAIDELRKLCEKATITTPNLYEAKELFGYDENIEFISPTENALLIKNIKKTVQGEDYSIDELYIGNEKKLIKSYDVKTDNLHGTGCSYSSAIAANLAKGIFLKPSCQRAKDFVYYGLLNAPNIGHGFGPINHYKAGRIINE
jgi:hydroxymethylpyrimidine/phosphomethylpyrimidine kinase